MLQCIYKVGTGEAGDQIAGVNPLSPEFKIPAEPINSLAAKFELRAQLHSAEIKMSPHVLNCKLERFLRFDASFGYG